MAKQSSKNIPLKTIIKNLSFVTQAAVLRNFNKPTKPRFCTFAVTWKCNNKCSMCDVWKKKNLEPDLSYEEIDNIFKQKELHKLNVIRISGGEPFLRKDLSDIIKSISDNTKAQFIHITSNGYSTKQIIDTMEDILDYGVKVDLKISLEATDKVHDKIRGVSGAVNKTIKTLNELKKLREKYDFYLGINQTVSEENKDKIHEVRNFAETQDFGFHTALALSSRPVYVEGTDQNMRNNPERFSLFTDFTEKELNTLIKEMRRKSINSDGSFLEDISWRFYLQGLENRLLKNRDYPNPPCVALFSHMRLNPNGDIIICSYKTNVIGNLRKNSFKEIWFSKKAEKYRKIVKTCPGCWAGCEVIPNAFQSGYIGFWLLKDLIKKPTLPKISRDFGGITE